MGQSSSSETRREREAARQSRASTPFGGASGPAGTSTPGTSTFATPDPPSSTTRVDGGFLEPQSHLYASSSIDYSRPIVHKYISERRLAPFYLGLNDFEPDWDIPALVAALEEGDKQATTNLTEALEAATEAATEAEVAQLSNPPNTRKGKEAAAAHTAAVVHREKLAELIRLKEKRGGGLRWSSIEEQAKLYQGQAVECPICFLYYPPAMVSTRCCDQPICTECFVQIKRADPTATHLESEPAACPFCMELNFGCMYIRQRPVVKAMDSVASNEVGDSGDEAGSSGISLSAAPPKPRRKSFAHTEKSVVTTDQLHPDWEAKVEAVKATVARRANRRIVFRQVGDRLIPVGITSGRESDGANATMSTSALPPGFAAQVAAALDPSSSSGSGSGGRRATRRRNQEMAQYLESMGVTMGPDLEEMMVMEAMRLSLQEDEERQKKAQEEEEKKAKAAGSTAESSAQGAARASLLSEAMSAPISSGSLPSPPAATSSTTPPPTSTNTPSATRQSTSTTSSSSRFFSRPSHHTTPSLGALAAGAVAATVSTPSAATSFPQQADKSPTPSVARGVVGASLTAHAPLRSSPPSSSSPPAQASASGQPSATETRSSPRLPDEKRQSPVPVSSTTEVEHESRASTPTPGARAAASSSAPAPPPLAMPSTASSSLPIPSAAGGDASDGRVLATSIGTTATDSSCGDSMNDVDEDAGYQPLGDGDDGDEDEREDFHETTGAQEEISSSFPNSPTDPKPAQPVTSEYTYPAITLE